MAPDSLSPSLSGTFLERAGLRRLDDVAVATITGDDARTWLNGQITQDITSLRARDALPALFVEPKGKILCDATVLAGDGNALRLIVPRSRKDAIAARFDKYIIMEDVTAAFDDDAVLVTVQGRNALDHAVREGEHFHRNVFHHDRFGVGGGFDLLTTRSSVDAVEALILRDRNVTRVTDEDWSAAFVLSGTPRFDVDYDGTHLPQEAGLEHRMVSFTKGCYLGQEVVHMLEHRGKVQRRLVQMRSDRSALARGNHLRVEGADIGAVTSVATHGGAHYALGYVRRAHAEPGRAVEAIDAARSSVPLTVVHVIGERASPSTSGAPRNEAS